MIRRIRLLLDTWDRVDVAAQEAAVGRRQRTNERIGAKSNAHVALAAPVVEAERMLRRSYAYDAGADPNGLLDAGLIFVCFQRDPGQQFIPVQRRLAERDALNAFSQHTASAVFACPPAAGAGPATGAWIGSGRHRVVRPVVRLRQGSRPRNGLRRPAGADGTQHARPDQHERRCRQADHGAASRAVRPHHRHASHVRLPQALNG